MFQTLVNVVWFSEAEAALSAIDYAVIHCTVTPVTETNVIVIYSTWKQRRKEACRKWWQV